MFVFLIILGLLGAVWGSIDNPPPLAEAPRGVLQSPYLPVESANAYRTVVYAFRDDAEYGGRIPWGLIAGIAEFGSEHGKLSPYPADLCDRNSDQPLLRSKPGLDETQCGEETPDFYPDVTPAIGNGEAGEGMGPYLLLPGSVDVDAIDVNRVAARSAFTTPTTATEFVAFEINRIRRQLVDEEGVIAPEPGDSAGAREFWGLVISRLGVADSAAAICPPVPIPLEATAEIVGTAVAQSWRCILLSRALYVYDPAGRKVTPVENGAADIIVNEALAVAYSFSGYGTPDVGGSGQRTANTPPGCAATYETTSSTDADGKETTTSVRIANTVTAGPDEPAGVFPLTQPVFEQYAENAALGRCDAGANIVAAANAVAAGERITLDEREGASEFEKAAGGWRNIPWALGDEATRQRLFTEGTSRPFDPTGQDKACANALTAWVDSLAEDGTLANAAGTTLTDTDGDNWPDELAATRTSIEARLTEGRPTETICPERNDGTIQRYAASYALGKQTVTEQFDHAGDDSPTSSGRTPAGTATATTTPAPPTTLSAPIGVTPGGDAPSDADTTTTTTPAPATTLPPVPTTVPAAPNALDMGYRGVYALMTFQARNSAEDTAEPARPGIDSQVLRLSPNGRAVEGVPYLRPPVSSRVTQIIRFAQAVGPLVKDDPDYNSSLTAEEFETLLKQLLPASYGGLIAGVPPVLMAAMNNAVVKAKVEYPQCTIDGALMAAIAYTEGGLWWDDIGPDGTLNPPLMASIPLGYGYDTDGGYMDKSATLDFALGIFQFAPPTWYGYPTKTRRADPQNEATWYGWARDGNDDGVRNPQNVWDEGYAAAANICANTGANDLLTWEGALQGLGVYVNGVNWNDPAKRATTEKLVHAKFDKAAEYRTMMAAASLSGSKTGGDAASVPPELLPYGNGLLPREILTPLPNRGGHRLYGAAAQDFIRWDAAARAAGVDLGITDSYRSYEQQVDLFYRRYQNTPSGEKTTRVWNGVTYYLRHNVAASATPGKSNHGWGVTVDLDVRTQGVWIHTSSMQYGFCANVAGEAWHFNWVGIGGACNPAWSPNMQALR